MTVNSHRLGGHWESLSGLVSGQGAGQALPTTARELADVLGRERALFLIGQLPVCYVLDKRNNNRPGTRGERRVILYVPKRLKPDHRLVKILGWVDAQRLVDAFGGEIINPPTLHNVVYRPFRDEAIAQAAKHLPAPLLSEWFGVSESYISRLAPQEEITAANDNTSRLGHQDRQAEECNKSKKVQRARSQR